MNEARQIVRIINADIVGTKQVYHGLTSIFGVGFSFSSAICNVLDVDVKKKIGNLTNEEVKKIEDIIKNPAKYGIPQYLYNRRKDLETGLDKHIVTSELKLAKDFDIKKLKRIKCYRGIRHSMGLPVRGQKTRSNFRKGKTVGVSKKRTAQQQKKQERKGEKK